MKNVAQKLCVLVVSVLVMTSINAQTQQLESQKQRRQMLEINKQMTTEEINDYYKQMMKRKPNAISLDKINIDESVKEYIPQKSAPKKALQVPDDMIFPIESDEVQAILIEWPYITKQKGTNNYAEAMFDGYGLVSDWFGNYSLVETTSTPDVALASEYAKLHGKLANAIQKHAEVWIDVWYNEDTITIKNYMESRGTPLTNYRFFVHHGNSFWARDWGPVAFYYGDEDSIAFMDFEYYGARPLDNDLPIWIANNLGWKCYTNTIEYEGGNILVDGLGNLFTTSALYETNQDIYGLYYLDWVRGNPQINMYQKRPLTKQQIEDSVKHLMNLNNIEIVTALDYDGGTGHIDLYADMWEESGFIMASYPKQLAAWTDAKRVDSIAEVFTSMKNSFGQNYDIVRVPLPAKDNGMWYSNGEDYNGYTRCWANHTFVNDAIIQPVFYDTTLTGSHKGDVEGNKRALNVLKTAYPGYTFEEIDVRSFDGYGGAIHCITKQIPADNPVRIYHQPARWFNTEENGTKYNVEVFSQNKSGIENVKIFYKSALEGEWHDITMTSLGDNKYFCEINLDGTIDRDTLYYYISSTSNNGKTMLKPMTAHQGGFYVMPYGKEVITYNNNFAWDTLADVTYDTTNLAYDKTKVTYGTKSDIKFSELKCISQKEFSDISEIFPNPAKDEATITINNTKDLYFRIVNLKGQIQQNGKIAKNTSTYIIDTKKLKTGHYWLILSDGNFSTSRSLIIVK